MIEDGDSRLHFGFDNEILKQRSRHDVLVPIEVRIGINRRTIQTALRVASEAHLRMTLQRECLEQQFDSVRKVMLAVAAGLMNKGSDYSEAKGHGYGSGDAMLAHWIGWGVSIKRAQIDMGIIQDIVLLGKSARDVDRERQKRKGHAVENLIEGLRLW
jgi:hypothetical protein